MQEMTAKNPVDHDAAVRHLHEAQRGSFAVHYPGAPFGDPASALLTLLAKDDGPMPGWFWSADDEHQPHDHRDGESESVFSGAQPDVTELPVGKSVTLVIIGFENWPPVPHSQDERTLAAITWLNQNLQCPVLMMPGVHSLDVADGEEVAPVPQSFLKW
jgi:hypothetical protein